MTNLKEKVLKAKSIIEGYSTDPVKYEDEFDELFSCVGEYNITEKIEHNIGRDSKDCIGYSLTLCAGGPSVFVDTEKCEIKGVWGDEEYSLSIPTYSVSFINNYISRLLKKHEDDEYNCLYEVKDDDRDEFASSIFTPNDLLEFASDEAGYEITELYEAKEIVEGRGYTIYNLNKSFEDYFN